ncbi:MAG: recombinase family protein [Paracoccaceae bacterium]
MKKIRCAIYTRKSSEEGLEQEFNSLDAQREACEAYITSQKAEGWVLLPEHYDDGGISGGTMERPALQRLLKDIDRAAVDQIMVYKIDRLTRSLADFSKIVDRLDAADTAFVSVTQSFNTATSMGRLTLNMLLSFAQFEREVTAERIRDKIAASKKKGLWMGGNVPLGYEPDGRTLKILEPDAQIIRAIYDLYKKHNNIRATKEEIDQLGLRTAIRTLSSGRLKGGTEFSFGHIHHILTNPIYAGRIRHKANVYPGLHKAIIEPGVWDKFQEQLIAVSVKSRSAKERNRGGGRKQVSLLVGKIFDQTGDRLTPSHSKSAKGHRLRYYVSHRLIRHTGPKDPSGWRLPGPELEALVAKLVATQLRTPSFKVNIVADTSTDELAAIDDRLVEATKNDPDGCDEMRMALLTIVGRVDVAPGNIKIELLPDEIADILAVNQERITEENLNITSEFRHRKRGVETKLIIADEAGTRDETLFRNIALAHRYFAMIRSGKTYHEIAEAEGASKRRIQHLVELAFLAPDVIRDVWEGSQSVGLTSEWLVRHSFPPIWQEQREMFRAL